MANEIKIEGLGIAHTAAKPITKEVTAVNVPSTNEGITITNHLGTLVNTLVAQNKTPLDHQRIFELKRQIENKQYHVDLDALASKLKHTLVS
jgi:anti-sigma28 factor (negative regulator of flagellin synthesis)